MASKNSEIRESRKSRVLGTLAGWIMKIWCSTLRYRVDDQTGGQAGAEPQILLLWHNRIFVIPAIWRVTLGRRRSCVVLTSASHDGSMLAKAMSVFGLGAIRGSSSRRGAEALRSLKRTLQENQDICITPDGPRGPRYVVQSGAIKLAQLTGAKMIPMHAKFSSAWRLKNWDRLVIPKPFSTVYITFGEPLAIPRQVDDAEFEGHRARIEAVLRAGADDV